MRKKRKIRLATIYILSEKLDDKYVIVWTYQAIFGHYIVIITLLNTVYVAN